MQQQISSLTTEKVANKYLNRLIRAEKIEVQRTFYLNDGQNSLVQLNCFTLSWPQKIKGFSVKTKDWQNTDPLLLEFQYDLRSLGKGRRKAYRVPFLVLPQFDDSSLTVSHLCHNSTCLNPLHVVLESLEDNKGRNGCPGPPLCRHIKNCLIPGPNHEGKTAFNVVLEGSFFKL